MLALGLALGACSPVGQSSGSGEAALGKSGKEDDGTPSVDPSLSICSKLNFEGITWSKSLPILERDPFALALNITGSFEGSRGFENLTGNFDGQGVSMGLLQQNLGQGSLQPMLIAHRDFNLSNISSFFTSAHFQALQAMLTKWETQPIIASKAVLEESGLSLLDDPELVAKESGFDGALTKIFFAAAISREQESVNWAIANVLTGTSLKADWALEFKALAGSPIYRSMQVDRAEILHGRALALFDFFEMTDVRSYLFFFDIIVQNGGIPESMRNELKTTLGKQPTLSETQRLSIILEKRLTIVKDQWRDDVRKRKTSLINGKGVVHGANRDYEKEFCAKIFVDFP